MANKRNHEWPLASVVDGFFTQDKAGGVTQRVPLSLIVSSIQGQNVFQPLDGDLTAIAAVSGTGYLQRTGANTWALTALTGWATKAYTNGSTTDVAEGTNLYYTDTRARAAISGTTPISVASGVVSHSSADGHGHVPLTGTTNNGKFLKAGSTAGSYSWQTLVVGDLPQVYLPLPNWNNYPYANFNGASAASYGLENNKGLSVTDARGLNWRGGFLSSDTQWGLSQDASSGTSFKPFVITDGSGTTWYKNDPLAATHKHVFTGWANFTSGVDSQERIDIIGKPLRISGVDAITSTREGRFTGMRLTNLSAGQMPVCSDGNSQITASGETDDGTYFSSNRILRLWNTLTKTGNTWTDLQWTQDAQERVSMLSSNETGAGACHTLAMVHADAEATGRVLGSHAWAQKVAGKSGTNPGVKVVLSSKTVGAGGSVGGFGGQMRIEYRPDNGPNLVDALRIGAFGSGTADAVETAILLRANAAITTTFVTFRDDTAQAPGLDLICGNGQAGHLRMINNVGAAILGGQIGDTELTTNNSLRLGSQQLNIKLNSARTEFAAPSSSYPAIRFPTQGSVELPYAENGDFWFDGTVFLVKINGVVREIYTQVH